MKQNWLMMWSGFFYFHSAVVENFIITFCSMKMSSCTSKNDVSLYMGHRLFHGTQTVGTDLVWAASTSQLQRYKLEYCQKHSIEWNTVDPKMKCWPRSVMCSWWQINILYFIYFLWNHSVRHCYLWTKSSKVTCWLKSISEVGRLDCATISNRLLTT